MKKKAAFIVVALLLVFGIVQIAAASGMGIGWGGGPRVLSGDNWVSPVKALNLTDDQINKMREIEKNTYQQTRDLRIKLQDKMYELSQLQMQKNPDKAQIDAKIKEINELRSKLSDIHQQSREKWQSLLTQEQLAQLAKTRGGCGMGPGGMGGHGGMGGFGRAQ